MQAGLLQPDSTWYMLKLSSMSTIQREWNALHSVHNLKFQQVLLSADVSTAARRTNPLQIPQVNNPLCSLSTRHLRCLLCIAQTVFIPRSMSKMSCLHHTCWQRTPCSLRQKIVNFNPVCLPSSFTTCCLLVQALLKLPLTDAGLFKTLACIIAILCRVRPVD